MNKLLPQDTAWFIGNALRCAAVTVQENAQGDGPYQQKCRESVYLLLEQLSDMAERLGNKLNDPGFDEDEEGAA